MYFSLYSIIFTNFVHYVQRFLCISLLYRYSSQLEAVETEVVHHETTACTQNETTMKDESIHVVRPEIYIEDIQNSDEKIQFYTGLPDFDIQSTF